MIFIFGKEKAKLLANNISQGLFCLSCSSDGWAALCALCVPEQRRALVLDTRLEFLDSCSDGERFSSGQCTLPSPAPEGKQPPAHSEGVQVPGHISPTPTGFGGSLQSPKHIRLGGVQPHRDLPVTLVPGYV